MSSSHPERKTSPRLSAFLRKFAEDSSFIREGLWRYRRWVAIGILSLILVDILEVVPPLIMKEAVDVAVENRPVRQFAVLALAYVGAALLQAICRYGWRMYLVRSSMYVGRDVRSRFAHHLFGLSMSFFDRRRIGDLMSLATSDTEAIRAATGPGLIVLLDSLFYFITVPVAMYLLSPKLTLLAFLPLPIIPFIVYRNEREIHERFEKVQEWQGRLSALAQEALTGIRVTKGFAKEDIQIGRMKEAGEESIRLNLHLARVHTAFGPTLDFFMSLSLVFLLYVGGRDIIQGGSTAVTLGTFVAFQRYIQKMIWPMAALGMALSIYQRGISSSGRLKEILAIEPDVPDPAGAQAPAQVRGEIELRDLSFRFPGTEKDILKGISLKIAPGERVAFIGSIGSGKSALLSLLPRLYPVGRGMLLVDGIDVNDWPIEALRQNVGYVSQDVFLFSETVTENVAFGLARSGGIASIEEATQLAAVHEDVLGLVSSYQTRLGERGVNLSGGQKQRLTIARAIAKQPRILVLDDALSSVDVQTEEKILQGLRARPNRNTEIISAHRISTIKDADRIVVLNEGRIAQQGNHRELIQDRAGIYYRYYQQQQLQEELEKYVGLLDREASQEVPDVLRS